MAKNHTKKKISKKTNENVDVKEHYEETSELRTIQYLQGNELLGRYCNLAIINHTPREFIIDFVLNVGPDNLLESRIITSPQHVKKFHEVLGNNIKKYEENFGKIVTNTETESK